VYLQRSKATGKDISKSGVNIVQEYTSVKFRTFARKWNDRGGGSEKRSPSLGAIGSGDTTCQVEERREQGSNLVFRFGPEWSLV